MPEKSLSSINQNLEPTELPNKSKKATKLVLWIIVIFIIAVIVFIWAVFITKVNLNNFKIGSSKPSPLNSAIKPVDGTLESAKYYTDDLIKQLNIVGQATKFSDGQWVGTDGNFIDKNFSGFSISIASENLLYPDGSRQEGFYKAIPDATASGGGTEPNAYALSAVVQELKKKTDSYFISHNFKKNSANSTKGLYNSIGYEKNGVMCSVDFSQFITYANFGCQVEIPSPTPLPPPDLTTNNWKVYTNSKFKLKIIYPAKGEIATTNGPFGFGECGKGIAENKTVSNIRQGYMTNINVDNFFWIAVYNWDKSIEEYMKKYGEDVDGISYYTIPITDSNADEALIIGKIKHYGTGQGSFGQLIGDVFFKKDNYLFELFGLQNPGNIGGCVPSGPHGAVSQQGNWNIAESIKFF